MSRLSEVASRFRAAIIRVIERSPHDLPPHFCHFPNGCCSDASTLLATYLRQEHSEAPLILFGENGQRTHAWLNVRGAIIDITGDQFADYGPNQYVLRESVWHDQFSVPRPRSSSDEDMRSTPTSNLWRALKTICAELRAQ